MRAGIRMDQKTKSNPRARGFMNPKKRFTRELLVTQVTEVSQVVSSLP